MERESSNGIPGRIKRFVFGRAISPMEPGVFRKLSLVAFLAWIGLGADGISSSCYGPAEGFLALGGHTYLAIILALLTALTVFVISASYKQVMEKFPTGGGSYLVASKLISPNVGMVAGCALVVDYVLTITVSVASGADAIFSFLPVEWQSYKLLTAMGVLILLIGINIRGVKESVVPIVPIFLVFIITHGLVILYALIANITGIPTLVENTGIEIQTSVSQMGFFGVLFLVLYAYSLGGGTYTGIEAISNGLPLLREPRVKTGKRTMTYMAISLAFMACGLILGYLFYGVQPEAGKTLNAILFNKVAYSWWGGNIFVMVALISEAFILLVAAQTGFLGGPMVLANLAMDQWMPSRLALLSDRLVTMNGILMMGGASLLLLWFSGGSVSFLVILYSINVFLTFSLSQMGMVKLWWKGRKREKGWSYKIMINGVGFILTAFILLMVIIMKFDEGGWLTLVVTTSLIAVAVLIKRHYRMVRGMLKHLDELHKVSLPANGETPIGEVTRARIPQPVSPGRRTAIILVNGYNGLGLHTLLNVIRNFPHHFNNFVFLQVGVIDAGRFKGIDEIENLKESVEADLARYVEMMRSHGYYAESVYALGTDVAYEAKRLIVELVERFPNAIVFTSQLVFPHETVFTRMLHNYTPFAIQKRLYHQGIPVLIMPIRVRA